MSSNSTSGVVNANNVIVGADSNSASGPTSDYATVLLEKDVFVCSELERASHCLASVTGSLNALNAFLTGIQLQQAS